MSAAEPDLDGKKIEHMKINCKNRACMFLCEHVRVVIFAPANVDIVGDGGELVAHSVRHIASRTYFRSQIRLG